MMSPSSASLWIGLVIAAAFPAALTGQIAPGKEIITLSGHDNVHEITLSTQVATSISFPSEITLVTGYGFVLDAARAQELIDSEAVAAATLKDLAPQPVTIVHYAQAARDTLVVRAIRRGTPCYVTVRCGPRIYLFKMSIGDNANLAVVISDKAPGAEGTVELKKEDVLKTRINYSSTDLLGILSRAKGRGFLETVNPSLYEGWSQRRGLRLTSSGNVALKSTITEIQQWPQKDALVFRAVVENSGPEELHFKPGDVRIRVGDALFPVQLADSSGFVRPGGSTALDVVLQGNPAGGQEHVSIQNDFRLEIAANGSPPPGDLIPPPNPLLPALEVPGGMIEVPVATGPRDSDSKNPLRSPLPSFHYNK